MRISCVGILASMGLVAGTGSAAAQALAGVPSETWAKEEWPTEVTERTVTLPQGMLVIPVELTAYTDAPAYILSPGVYYGVSSLLTVGIRQHTVHVSFDDRTNTSESQTELPQIELDATFKFLGETDLALRGQLPVRLFDPTLVDLRAGLEGRLVFANRRAALRFHAGVVLNGVVSDGGRDEFEDDDLIVLPDIVLTTWFQSTERFALGFQLGFTAYPTALVGTDEGSLPLKLVASYGATGVDILVGGGVELNDDLFGGPVLELGVRIFR